MRLLSIIAAVLILSGAAADAQSTTRAQGFLTHAAFFSLETKQANLLDPEVFVADLSVAAATGPQGIMHVAGVRPAFGVDDPNTKVETAQGKPLGFTLGQWFGAGGRGTLSATPGDRTAMT